MKESFKGAYLCRDGSQRCCAIGTEKRGGVYALPPMPGAKILKKSLREPTITSTEQSIGT